MEFMVDLHVMVGKSMLDVSHKSFPSVYASMVEHANGHIPSYIKI